MSTMDRMMKTSPSGPALPAGRTWAGWALAAFLVVAGAAPAAQAQIVLTGTVVAGDTGEPLPSASVHLDGTLRGTIANGEGVFALAVDSLPADLVVRFVGFETVRIRRLDAAPFEVELPPMVYQMEELVVSGEDPAVRIMREVIRRKQTWRASLDTYRADAYNRFTMQNDTGIVSVMESMSSAFWRRDDGMREIVRANRQTNNLTFDSLLPAARFMANFYDDDIELAGYTFVGVTHPDALRHYDFTLTGTWRQNDQVVYDIQVQPRNRLKAAFVGRVSVLDGEFAMLDVQLEPGEAFLFPPPIDAFDVTYEQQFADFDAVYWLPVDLRARMAIDISFRRLLAFPTIVIDQVTRLTNYATNVPVPDSIYADDREMIVDSASVQSNTLLAMPGVRVTVSGANAGSAPDSMEQASLVVPLTRAEAAAYATIDSTMTLEKAYMPTGPLARMIDTDDEEEGDASDASAGGGLGISFTPALHYNRVEGLYAGALLARTWADLLTLRAGGGYGTATGSSRLSYRAGLSLERRRSALHAHLLRGVATIQESAPLLLSANGLVMLFGGYDYFDYYWQQGLTLEATTRVPDADLSFAAGLAVMDLEALEATVDYNLLGVDRVHPANPSVSAAGTDAARRASLHASVRYGDADPTFGVTGRRFVELGIEWSQPGFLESEHGFARYRLNAEWQVPTFFQRRLLANTLHLRAVAFTVRGDTPVWAYGSLDSRMGVVAPFGRFKTLPGRPYTAPSGVALFWEHNFRTLFFEMLGWRRLARDGYGVLVFGGHGRMWNPDNSASLRYGPMYGANDHHEVGLSLSGLFSLFRLDAAVRLDAPGVTVGLAAARLF